MLKNKKISKHIHSQKNQRKTKKIKIVIIAIIIAIIIAFFIKFNNNVTKISKIGNNSSSQEIVNYVLNISSYEAEIEVQVNTNKNTNKYKLKQIYINNENITQEVIEPSNIQGVKIIREKNSLRIENTKLSLTKIIENYKEITQNNLDLMNFIENYKKNNNSKFKEEDNQIIMETVANTEGNYQKYLTLYVSNNNGNPIKMEVKDTNKNTLIYIIYNEIKINKVANEKIYAFKLFDISREI